MSNSDDAVLGCETEAGRMGQQVSHRRPLGSSRLVEVQRSLFDGNKSRVGEQGLGDRRELERLRNWAMCLLDTCAAQPSGSAFGRRPIIDLVEESHSG